MSDIKPAIRHTVSFNRLLLITLQRGRNTFGYFAPERFTAESSVSELAMNPDYFGGRSLADTLSTLVNEMVHVWQHYAPLKNAGAAIMIVYGARRWRKSGLCHQIPAYLAGKRTGSR